MPGRSARATENRSSLSSGTPATRTPRGRSGSRVGPERDRSGKVAFSWRRLVPASAPAEQTRLDGFKPGREQQTEQPAECDVGEREFWPATGLRTHQLEAEPRGLAENLDGDREQD